MAFLRLLCLGIADNNVEMCCSELKKAGQHLMFGSELNLMQPLHLIAVPVSESSQ